MQARQFHVYQQTRPRLVSSDWVETDRDPSLYRDVVDRISGGLGGSVLFAYKLDWQTVLLLGYAEHRQLLQGMDGREDRLEPADRQVFLKLGYALQM